MEDRVKRAIAERGMARAVKDVFIACYDRIISRKIISVSELMEYLDDLEWDPKLESVVRKCYPLIRELHWGAFRELDREHYGKLWKTLVIPDRRFPDMGDLKRNVQVSDVYCGMLDIHEYTEFCQKNRHNFSMLRTLDDIIQQDIRRIAAKNRCLSYRAAGDNIILIGSAAIDVLRTSLGVIDCFSRKRVLRDSGLSETRKGYSIVLQDVHVSAGIAGGLQYSSIVITQGGDVSGSIINTAARLQSFANSLSPQQSKVLVTSQVQASAARDLRREKDGDQESFGFFGCGKIQFKGVELGVHEVLYREADMCKLDYEGEYAQLLKAMSRGGWKDKIVEHALALVIRSLEVAPIPRVEIYIDGSKETYTTEQLIGECKEALRAYRDGEDHRFVSRQLGALLEVLESTAGFDRLVLTRFRQVVTIYRKMAIDYETRQYDKIVTLKSALFTAKEQQVMEDAARLEIARTTLIERGRNNTEVISPALLWKQVVSDHEGSWDFEVYSGKR